MPMFPSQEWVQEIYEKLNSDECYAQIARNWEGDMRFVIEPSGPLTETVNIYLDLWHGKCRLAVYEDPNPQNSPAFILKAPYENFSRVINGELEPMQALLTRKLSVHGNMAVLMRNIPTVLDFVRCCREITDRVL